MQVAFSSCLSSLRRSLRVLGTGERSGRTQHIDSHVSGIAAGSASFNALAAIFTTTASAIAAERLKHFSIGQYRRRNLGLTEGSALTSGGPLLGAHRRASGVCIPEGVQGSDFISAPISEVTVLCSLAVTLLLATLLCEVVALSPGESQCAGTLSFFIAFLQFLSSLHGSSHIASSVQLQTQRRSFAIQA